MVLAIVTVTVSITFAGGSLNGSLRDLDRSGGLGRCGSVFLCRRRLTFDLDLRGSSRLYAHLFSFFGECPL